VKRKYDGEYCQVHVQRSSGGEDRVTIFSKSGRNSTVDRKLLLPTIRTCLDLNIADCRIQRQCVLVGVLLGLER
jgi:DNA ligase 4